MSNPIYKDLPGVERKKNGSLYQMTPTQHRLARALIRRECCSYEDGNCMELDDGECYSCIQCHTPSVSCKWFRFAVLPLLKVLEAEIFRDRDTKAYMVCGKAFVPKSNRGKYCQSCAIRVHRRQKAQSEQKRRSKVDN